MEVDVQRGARAAAPDPTLDAGAGATKRRDRSSRTARRVTACLAIGFMVMSCGDDDSSSTASTVATTSSATTTTRGGGPTTSGSSTAATGDVCADREALSESVDALKNVDLIAGGTNGLTAAIDDVKQALTALRTSAGSELRPQVQAVQDSLDRLQTAAGNLGSGGGRAAVTAVSDLVTSAQTLLGSLQAGACGDTTTSTT